MRAAAVLVVMALLGCARDAKRPADEPPSNVRLLTIADVPEGFRPGRDERLSPRPDGPPFRPPDCVQLPATARVPEAVRSFERGDSEIIEQVAVFDSVDAARKDIDNSGPQPGCPTTTARAPGQPDLVLAAPSLLPAPPLGNESKAFFTAVSRTIVFRLDRVVVGVTVVHPRDDMDVVALARRALELVQQRPQGLARRVAWSAAAD